MRRSLLFILSCCVPASIAGQATAIPLGARVQVETHDEASITGTLMSQTEDSVIVATPEAPRVVASWESVARVQVSDGRTRTRGAVRGMKVGAAVGGGIIAITFGVAFLGARDANVGDLFAYVGSGAVVGAVYGAAIGSLVRAERWTTVYAGPTQVSFLPTLSGVPGVAGSIRF